MEFFQFPEYEKTNPAKVLANLYLSSHGYAKNIDLLNELEITHVLDLSNQPNRTDYAGNGKVYKAIRIKDEEETNIRPYFDEAYEFIESAGNSGVIVNCFAGISRSATIVLSYLMKKFNKNLKEAHTYLVSHKPNISPNTGFFQQLIEFEGLLGMAPSFDLCAYLAIEVQQIFPAADIEVIKQVLARHNNDVYPVYQELSAKYPEF